MNAITSLKASYIPQADTNVNKPLSDQTLKVIELLREDDYFLVPDCSHLRYQLLFNYLQDRLGRLENETELNSEVEKISTAIKNILAQFVCKTSNYEDLLDKYDDEPAIRKLNLFFDLYKKGLKNFIDEGVEKKLSTTDLLIELRRWLDPKNTNYISPSALDETFSYLELLYQSSECVTDLPKDFKRRIYKVVLDEVIKDLCLSSNHESGTCYGHTVSAFSLLPNQFGAAFWQERCTLYNKDEYFETKHLIELGKKVEINAASLPLIIKKASYVLDCSSEEVLNHGDKDFLYHLLGRLLVNYFEKQDRSMTTMSEKIEFLTAFDIYQNQSPFQVSKENEIQKLSAQFFLEHPAIFPTIAQKPNLLDKKIKTKFLTKLPVLEKELYHVVRREYFRKNSEQKELPRLGLSYIRLEACAPIDQLLTTIKDLYLDGASHSSQKFYFLGLDKPEKSLGHRVGFTLCPQFSFFDSNDYDYLSLRPVARTFTNFEEFSEYLVLYLIHKYDYELFSISSYQRSDASSPLLQNSLLNWHCQQLAIYKKYRTARRELIRAKEAHIEKGLISEKKKKRLEKFCRREVQRLEEEREEDLKNYLLFITPSIQARINELNAKKEAASDVKSVISYDRLIKSYQSVLDLSEYG